MRAALIVLITFVFAPHLHAQDYFQQRVDTRIAVRLDDEKHFLHGYLSLDYINNSPDTLRGIWWHLYPNAYAHDRTAFCNQQIESGKTAFYFSKPASRGFIDSLRFSVGGRTAIHSFHPDTPDVAWMPLPQPLLPGEQVTITTPFRVKIPRVFSRLGHTGQAYYISQWFPKPAVYDRTGWHPMPYLDQGEFYSEFGTYDVSITLPRNYVVMATGNLQESSEEEAWLDSLAATPLPPDTLWRRGFPPSHPVEKTLRFHEENVHDFAWFADKRWTVRKDTAHLGYDTAQVFSEISRPASSDGQPGEQRRDYMGDDVWPRTVTAWVAFLPGSTDWAKDGTRHALDAVRHYSRMVGPYGYQTVKAVEGDLQAGGGMEYPTVTLIDRGITGTDLRTVIVHEVGHNWFQGMLASNERDFPWLDEGFNSFYEEETIRAILHADTGRTRSRAPESSEEYALLAHRAGTGFSEPLSQHSARFQSLAYGLDVYKKTARHLRWLRAWMGQARFDSAMHAYFRDWAFRHPSEADFRAAVEAASDRPVGWFFDAINQPGMPDHRITGVKREGDALRVRLRARPAFTGSAIVEVRRDTALVSTYFAEATGKRAEIVVPADDSWNELRISPAVADRMPANNRWTRRGILHGRGPALSGLLGFQMGPKKKVWIAPGLGANAYDGFMAGLVLHNAFTAPQSRFRFAVAPLWSTRIGSLVGTGSVGHFWYPQRGSLREVSLRLDGRSFHYDAVAARDGFFNRTSARYWKAAPTLEFVFREATSRSPVTRTLQLRGFGIGEQNFRFERSAADSTVFIPNVEQTERLYYGRLRYMHRAARTLNPYSYTAEAQAGRGFAKLGLEGTLRIDYHRARKGLHLRGFAGKFIPLAGESEAFRRRYWLNSTVSGPFDYLYEGTYVGRSEQEGLGARQVTIAEGGLKLPTPFYATPLGRSGNWLAAINIKTDLPLKALPVRAYFDASTFAQAPEINPSGARFLWSGGLEVYLPFADVVSVYIPLVNSADYRDYLRSIHGNSAFGRSISFTLRLDGFNWLDGTNRALRFLQ